MNRTSRRLNAVLAPVCLALAAVVFAAPAGAAAIHFEKESQTEYEGQLHKGEVHAVTFHPGASTGHLHLSLNNGGHMSVTYAASRQGKLVAQAQAANARVKIATLKTKKTAAAHHKLRYIVGGILIVVILFVLVVLLIGRRRAAADEGQGPSGESAAS
jgi:predicted NAD/FAD-dependent oxidoreductase